MVWFGLYTKDGATKLCSLIIKGLHQKQDFSLSLFFFFFHVTTGLASCKKPHANENSTEYDQVSYDINHEHRTTQCKPWEGFTDESAQKGKDTKQKQIYFNSCLEISQFQTTRAKRSPFFWVVLITNLAFNIMTHTAVVDVVLHFLT